MRIPESGHAQNFHSLFPAQSPQREPTITRAWAVPEIDQSRAVLEVHAINDKMKDHIVRVLSVVFGSGDSPPCMQRNCLLMMAASGSEHNDSMQAS